jgi:hypothetical protein
VSPSEHVAVLAVRDEKIASPTDWHRIRDIENPGDYPSSDQFAMSDMQQIQSESSV